MVSDYAEIIEKLKEVITASGKKCYEVLVGKLNEPKLKNLPSIEMYVYVGCRETSLISSREFMMPICTPHELLMALLPDLFPWQSKIITDFQLLLPVLRRQELSSTLTEREEETKSQMESQMQMVAYE